MTTTNPYFVPTRHLNTTEEVIAASQTGSYGTCLIAQTVRMRLGAQSVYVTADVVKFNLMGIDPVDGKEKMMRYCYPTPALAGAKASKFDVDGEKRGDNYARGQVKPFKFMLQGERAFAKPVIPRPNSKRGPTRNHSTPAELASACPRRYHGKKTFKLNDNDL